MERTATQDTEYVDIVLGYRHILLFSLVFGALIFGTGYFAGYQSGQKAESARADSTTTPNPPQASPPAQLPPVQVPAMLTEPINSGAGNVVEELEELSQESLAPGTRSTPEPAAAAPPPASPEPAAEVAPPPAKPRTEEKPAASAPADEPEKEPVPQARAAPAGAPPAKQQASGNVYLQVSSFGAQQDAEQLIDALAAEGFRALIDGQMIGGKHTVLVGPFDDFKAAVGKAKELRRTNREAFPIRR